MAERYPSAAGSAFTSTLTPTEPLGHWVPRHLAVRGTQALHGGIRSPRAGTGPDGTSDTRCQFPHPACLTSHRKHSFRVNAPACSTCTGTLTGPCVMNARQSLWKGSMTSLRAAVGCRCVSTLFLGLPCVDVIERVCNDLRGFKNSTLSQVRFMKPTAGGDA